MPTSFSRDGFRSANELKSYRRWRASERLAYTHTDTRAPVCSQKPGFLRNPAKNLLPIFQPACHYQQGARGALEFCKMKFSFPFEGILCLKIRFGKRWFSHRLKPALLHLCGSWDWRSPSLTFRSQNSADVLAYASWALQTGFIDSIIPHTAISSTLTIELRILQYFLVCKKHA